MDYRKEPQPGEFYKHFKDKLYQIITVAIHSETREKLVIYQALYGEYKSYARPIDMFLSEVDKEKYPEVSAKYRFEKVIIGNTNEETNNNVGEKSLDEHLRNSLNNSVDKKETEVSNKEVNVISDIVEVTLDEAQQINPLLLEFLDAKTYEEKVSIVHYNKQKMTNELINAMSASMDCTVEEGELESRINSFLYCLRTLERFENKRLR